MKLLQFAIMFIVGVAILVNQTPARPITMIQSLNSINIIDKEVPPPVYYLYGEPPSFWGAIKHPGTLGMAYIDDTCHSDLTSVVEQSRRSLDTLNN